MAGSNHLKVVDDSTFESSIASGVTLVDFYADWCGPCRMQTPILEEIAAEMQGKVSVVKVDVDQSQKTASTFQVTSIPTLILFENGKETKRVVGLRDAETLKSLILSSLASKAH